MKQCQRHKCSHPTCNYPTPSHAAQKMSFQGQYLLTITGDRLKLTGIVGIVNIEGALSKQWTDETELEQRQLLYRRQIGGEVKYKVILELFKVNGIN